MKNAAFGIVALLAVGGAAWAYGSKSLGGTPTAKVRGLKTTVNEVGWYNSFAEAQKEAKRTNRPILLLSMFGEIDEDMPCANARTLRATLFKDPDFKKLADNDLIPVWEEVRAVPHIEIDLGDGKKIRRTVRGNAIMYLCNPDGKVVDAYPGIYTKDDFIPMVRESIAKLASAPGDKVISFHKTAPHWVRGVIPTTMSKTAVEAPTLALMGAPSIAGAAPEEVKPGDSQERREFLWAARGLRDMSLMPVNSEEAMVLTTGKTLEQVPPKDRAALILKSDSKRNMDSMRPLIHLWFSSLKSLPTPLEARDTVLQTILKIPYKDPYFGLKDVLIPGTPE
jgi:hypothetical protein